MDGMNTTTHDTANKTAEESLSKSNGSSDSVDSSIASARPARPFGYLPVSVAVHTEMDNRFVVVKLRNGQLAQLAIDVSLKKSDGSLSVRLGLPLLLWRGAAGNRKTLPDPMVGHVAHNYWRMEEVLCALVEDVDAIPGSMRELLAGPTLAENNKTFLALTSDGRYALVSEIARDRDDVPTHVSGGRTGSDVQKKSDSAVSVVITAQEGTSSSSSERGSSSDHPLRLEKIFRPQQILTTYFLDDGAPLRHARLFFDTLKGLARDGGVNTML